MKRIVVYGAAAVRQRMTYLERLYMQGRTRWHLHRDALAIARGDTDGLDFRNYISSKPENIGDVAIADTVVRLIAKEVPDAQITRCNWGGLNALRGKRFGPEDLLVVAGSGYLSFDRDDRLTSRVADDLEFIRETNVRVMLLGIGVNRPGASNPDEWAPLDAKADHDLLAALLTCTQCVSVRDEFSVRTLAAAGSDSVSLTGDPALHFASTHSLTKPRRVGHGGSPVVGINFSFHGPNSTTLLQANLCTYAAALKEIQRKLKCQYRYFVHYSAEQVIPSFLAALGVNTEVVVGEPADLVERYNQLDLHVAGMLHSSILAGSVDTPCVALAYDIKHRGFFDLFGLGRFCVPAPGISKAILVDRVLEAYESRLASGAAIHDRRLTLQSATSDFLAGAFGPR